MENIQEDNWGGGLADSYEPTDDGIQEATDPSLFYKMDKAEVRACSYLTMDACGLAVSINDLLRAGKKEEGLKMLQDPKNKGLLSIIPREVRNWFGMTVSNSYRPDGEEIQEKVDIDGRTRSFKDTVMRLEQLRQTRSNKTDNYKGLYDDGSGRGASLPNPISFNKESRSTLEIDGRANALKEALKRVESYRKMREAAKKKKTLLGMKESDENMHEGTSLTRGQILDAVGMTNNKFEVTEEELSSKQKEYRAFFQKALKKHDAKSPADLDDAGKKKFFDYVKANWKG